MLRPGDVGNYNPPPYWAARKAAVGTFWVTVRLQRGAKAIWRASVISITLGGHASIGGGDLAAAWRFGHDLGLGGPVGERALV